MFITSALLDTSFLISLTNQTRETHDIAHQYYKYMIEQKITLFLSSIVVSEFCVRQPITDLPLRNFKILPFNVPDAIESADIYNKLKGNLQGNDSRTVIRNDINIIAQAIKANIPVVLTDDARTFYRDCEKLSNFGKNVRAIVLKNGFDSSQLRFDGQKDIQDIIT
jgi:predicted nucleic acid-binding protein